MNGDTVSNLTTAPILTSTQVGVPDAGTYNGNFGVSGGTASNYSFSYIPGNLTVQKKGLTITADNQHITYGDAIAADTVSYAGFITGEDATYLTTAPTVASAQSGIADAGNYSGNFTASGATSGNYTISYVAGNLLVDKRILTASLTGTVSKQYDGTGTATLTCAE